MAFLDDLSKMGGVVLAWKFTNDGKVEKFKASEEVSHAMVNKASQYIATVSMLFDTLADAFTTQSEMTWVPQRCWTFTGGEWTVVAGNNYAVFCQTELTDIQKIAQTIAGATLVAEGGEGRQSI